MYIQCLAKPLKPQYNGGIVVNPELNQGLKGWTISGDANVALGESEDGNKYIVASTTKQSFFKQEFFLDQNKLYTFSGAYYVYSVFTHYSYYYYMYICDYELLII